MSWPRGSYNYELIVGLKLCLKVDRLINRIGMAYLEIWGILNLVRKLKKRKE
jgi:hypothetical protein